MTFFVDAVLPGMCRCTIERCFKEPGGVYTTLVVGDRNRMICMIIFFNTIWMDCQTG